VPSFTRWPLTLHFFDREVHAAWEKWCRTTSEPVRHGLKVVTDFGPAPGEAEHGSEWGVHALPLDYKPIRDYVIKTKSIFEFEREGNCAVCHGEQPPGRGLYAVCPCHDCEAVGHLTCWGRHLLAGEAGTEDVVLPRQGICPKCHGEISWDDMMKELSLRTRGAKEAEKLLKKPRRRKAAQVAESD
jgi:structure-specific endonuclease subunit SLX1